MMAKKQISINALKEEVKIYDEFIEIPLGENEEYILKLYPYFKPEKVRNLVKELSEFYAGCEEAKIEVSRDEEDDIIGFFIFKHFTNFKFTTSKKIKKIYDEYKILINASLFKTILKAIPEESITRVYDYIYETVAAGEKLQSVLEEAQNRIKDLPLESRNILFPNTYENVKNVLADPEN